MYEIQQADDAGLFIVKGITGFKDGESVIIEGK